MRQKQLWMVSIPLLLSALFLAAWIRGTARQDEAASAGWQVVGQIGGPTQAVAIQGNYAYVGVGLRLIVLDVTNPITPTEVGSTLPFPYFVEDIAISGTKAYVAAGGAGLRVVDISNPANPVETGAWDSPGYAEGVAVAGNIAYLADGPYGLRVVDVSNPAQPAPLGSAYEMNYAFEVAVAGKFAYIAAAGAGLLIADISDPANPSEAGALDTPGYTYGVMIVGNMAYVADGWTGLRVVDISNPAKPVEKSVYDTPGWTMDAAIAGKKIYLADGAFQLRIVDITDPLQPQGAGVYLAEGLAQKIVVAGNYAFIADCLNGLRIVSIVDPAHPAEITLYNPLPDARRVAVNGAYAYVAAGISGMRVVDISAPLHPKEVAKYVAGGSFVTSVVVRAPYAYLASGSPSTLEVLNISDSTHPVKVGALQTEGQFRDIAVSGQIVYIADEWGLRLIDVSIPTSPSQMSFLQLNQNLLETCGIAVSGTLAYLTGGVVRVVDVANPYNPQLIKVFESVGNADLEVIGEEAYIAAGGQGLRIVDVSDTSTPIETGYYDTMGNAQGVIISGTLAYVSDGGGGLAIVDIADNASPRLVRVNDTPGFAWFAALTDAHILVADGHGGLVILEKTITSGMARREEIPLITLDAEEFQSLNGAGISAIDFNFSILPSSGATSDPDLEYNNHFNADRDAKMTLSDADEPLKLTSVCLVTSSSDSGPGTLRNCLQTAQSGDTITFDPLVFPPTYPVSITIISELPPIQQGNLTIDGSNAGVILDGGNLPQGSQGLTITSAFNVVRGLQILRFPGYGVMIYSGNDNIIGGDRTLGTGPTGQGNVISQNQWGIGLGSEANLIQGNFIGTDPTGTMAWGNQNGIGLGDGAVANRIGGTIPGERNIISGNHERGIQVGGEGNIFAGNYIGTDASGTKSIGNGRGGVIIEGSGTGNTIGGSETGAGNVISGNNGPGVVLSDPKSLNNSVIGNLIGVDATGILPLGNNEAGVAIAAGYNRIGGTEDGERNVISGNRGPGIVIYSNEATDLQKLILGNFIGIDISGTKVLGNSVGVSVQGGRCSFIGGATATERNVISGSQAVGIDVNSADTEYNWIAGNSIGVDASGKIPLGNDQMGVRVRDYAAHNFIHGNTIAFNRGEWWKVGGVYVEHSPYNSIRRNSIYSNIGMGIVLNQDGNQMLAAPVITGKLGNSISGTACPGCTVEVFSDNEDEGRVYEGYTLANASGEFTFIKGSLFTGPHLTATATDSMGNSSEFSAPWIDWRRVYLPVTWR